MSEPLAAMVDIGFGLEGDALPRDHRRALAEALERALPWFAGVPGAGIHRLNLPSGDRAEAPLSGRTRLRLRVPRERAPDAAALAGAELRLGDRRLRVGTPKQRELLPYGTLYAHCVAVESAATEEADFLRAVQADLAQLGVPCRAICGRRQVSDNGEIQGFSLMLDGLSAEHSLRVLELGLGPHRRLGCGVFVAHRSASAVGAPA